jgi:hypothetical protein
MTSQELEAAKAAFLARNTVTQVEAGVAYGVDRDADKAKRAAERERVAYQRSEQEAERVREGYHTGGRRGAMEAMQGERYQDYSRDY